jgi:hypothetical protein
MNMHENLLLDHIASPDLVPLPFSGHHKPGTPSIRPEHLVALSPNPHGLCSAVHDLIVQTPEPQIHGQATKSLLSCTVLSTFAFAMRKIP